jgi:Rad3-related DNA helicase
VLIGPTLVEGVDLPDDLCRFIIIVKMPYPNIASKVVKAKMNLFPLWYSSATSNLVIQNIGRGVRNEHDWCTTFILDGCFQKLFESTADQYPPEMRARIQVINS